jgi:uncharacterized cupin superfamily protein
MADEQDETLREMARHRGLKLRKSRRRKPGGDFGRYGLVDAAGKAVLGIGDKGCEASAADIEAWLRDAARATWKSSAGTAKARRKPPPAPASVPGPMPEPEVKAAPEPKPRPQPKPKLKIATANLFARLPSARRAEAFTALLDRSEVRIERIVSQGQATPEDEPMVQAQDEWVILLQGEAGIRIEDSVAVTLRPGDYLTIAGGQRHWVTFTTKDEPTVWLAVHIG